MESSALVSLYGELEIGIRRVSRGAYDVTVRLDDPSNQAEVAAVTAPTEIDRSRLLELQLRPDEYGRELARQVFAAPTVLLLFAKARASLEGAGLLLRIRISIDPGALELQDLRWELLRDPENYELLATSQRILLSRFIYSSDMRRLDIVPRTRVTALVAVAAPGNHDEYGLAPIDRDREVDQALVALAGVEVMVLGQSAPVTLGRLVEALNLCPDILYLVCHGTLTRSLEPVLYLQNEAGMVAPVEGKELAGSLRDKPTVPRLIVLVSCESAGRVEMSQGSGAHAGVAPLLAGAGVPAVLAMQGKISMETMRIAMPKFFTELLVDGQVDRALAAARDAVRDRHDHWAPALFSRLKDGRLWSLPHFLPASKDEASAKVEASKYFQISESDREVAWTALCQSISRGHFTPILGPDLDVGLFGGTRELGRDLAVEHAIPHVAGLELAKVAQVLNIQYGRWFTAKAIQDAWARALRRHPDVPEDLHLPKLLDLFVQRRRNRNDDLYGILARLPASCYVDANPVPFLFKTLKDVGKHPEALYSRWRWSRDQHPAAARPRQYPTRETPLVYHAFGILSQEDTLVSSDDDYINYLIATSTYKLIPAQVHGGLSDGALIFLGFRLDEWPLRALFRLIMNLVGTSGLRKYPHIIQVDPEGQSIAKLMRIWERYFASDRDGGLSEPPISIYWGRAADFLLELERRMNLTIGDPAARADLDSW